ncbi:hypothetical protein PRZ48_009737 [Zasmidium cellare]|uniref:DhaL domain-containing protein n=1 Tax=Zasmidium cellare TaxID=395010 RepID=A0ABR0ECJ1_ZASCE|nr:hypothetical protein PRZ48_009737 [Zasmidium cellare]
MAVVVEQTLPFPPQSLDLTSPTRWNTLFPLLRPTVKPIQTPKGQTLLVDTSKSTSKTLHIIAIGSAGNFSSKLLDDRAVTAIVSEPSGGAGILTARDIPHALQSAGVDVGAGIVVVRCGKERRLEVHEPGLIEVTANGELETDHLLHLLGNATPGTKANPHQTAELVKAFVKGASSTHSSFHTEKADGNPAVLHAEGPSAFKGCREAVERDLRVAMKAHAGQEGDVVYSVHFGDVNGLSRLENYIIAGEIAKFLDAQNTPSTLSHSTILNHSALARGFSISIAPIHSSYLSPSPKPKPHTTTPSTTSTQPKSLAPTTSKIPFSDAPIRARIEAGCNAVIRAEPTITEYDTIVGDGDCGYTLRDGAKKVLDFIKDKDLTHLPQVVADLVSELEVNMGGTSGALYCIYLTALSASLASAPSIPSALKSALEQLCKYTRARVGDRTMMDALIPYIETLEGSGGDAGQAMEKAKEGVEGTKKMEAKLGRSTYLDESATRGVPDPGAYGLLVLFGGMSGV